MLNDIWNEVSDTWSSTPLYWSLIEDSYILAGGKAPNNYLDWLDSPNNIQKEKLREEFIKVFITVHNKFLTEEQKKIFKIANVFPTYEEKFKIKKEEKIFLKEYKIKEGVDLKAKIDVKDVKIGLKKIEENVKNRTK